MVGMDSGLVFFPGMYDSATYQATEFAKDPVGTIKVAGQGLH